VRRLQALETLDTNDSLPLLSDALMSIVDPVAFAKLCNLCSAAPNEVSKILALLGPPAAKSAMV
jgi:hypothetical protein